MPSLSQYAGPAADLVAVAVLVLALYLPRHGRRDMIVAYLGVNVGVLAVTAALSAGTVTAGLGLGLFGVLSIIRLRSEELAQHEIAYYFAALALGLLGGLTSTPVGLTSVLMAAILVATWLGDHPRLAPATRTQQLLLDRAFTDERGLVAHLEGLLGADVVSVAVRRSDLVNDTTLVDVRHRPSAGRATVPGIVGVHPGGAA